jgi:hypothetical protein
MTQRQKAAKNDDPISANVVSGQKLYKDESGESKTENDGNVEEACGPFGRNDPRDEWAQNPS